MQSFGKKISSGALACFISRFFLLFSTQLYKFRAIRYNKFDNMLKY